MLQYVAEINYAYISDSKCRQNNGLKCSAIKTTDTYNYSNYYNVIESSDLDTAFIKYLPHFITVPE